MTRRRVTLLPFASLVSLAGLAGCSGAVSPSSPADGGGVQAEASAPDGGEHADSGGDAGPGSPDSGSPDVGVVDAPAEAAPGDALATGVDQLLGITTDGQIIYTQGQQVMAVSVKGGPAQAIGPLTSPSAPSVDGYGVVFETYAGGVADTVLWTKAHGAHDLGAVSYATLNPDGTLVAAEGANAGTSTPSWLVLANTDGTNEHTVVPKLEWVGAWFGSNGTLVLPLGDPADGKVDGVYWLTPGGFSSQIGFGFRLTSDPTGAYVFQATTSGTAVLVKTADATSSPVDTSVDVDFGAVFDRQAEYFYYEKAGVLLRASVTSPSSPATLGTPPCVDIVPSPGGTLLYCTDGTSGYVAPAATGKFAAVPGASLTYQNPPAFTLDDRFLWYFVSSTSDWQVQPVGAGAAVHLASEGYSGPSDLRDSLLVVIDGSSLEIVDPSGATPTHVLASSAVYYELSPDLQWAAYFTPSNGSSSTYDLHAVALP